jgi:hypothetical protein
MASTFLFWQSATPNSENAQACFVEIQTEQKQVEININIETLFRLKK